MGAPKYVLLSYDEGAESTGEHGYEETWALCEDAADLFADPPPPIRETYELLGCAPEESCAGPSHARVPTVRRRSAASPWSLSTRPAGERASGGWRTYASSVTALARVTWR